ncbi:MAG TPA: heavy metal translocating P-type ATPase [Candidatus Saccharimonadales bacterium]|nr:heavy metal translocating P-type ATPase [Candidatus Saccharimonadales bacterium]
MKRFLRAARHYYLFTAACLGVLLALGLQVGGQHALASVLLVVITLAECVPFFAEIWRDLRSGKYGVDILAGVAVLSSVLLHQLWAAMVIILMLTGGRALEDYAGHRAERELDALLARAPRRARVLRGRKEVEIKAAEVRKGDVLIIRAGELVAADAEIETGEASFDESSLTGESLPQVKKHGGMLLSGSVNLDGPVTARAVRAAEDSQYQQIIKLVQAARASEAPFTRLADRYAVPFTLLAFVIAGVSWALSGHAIRFLEVLVVATPCPLLLAVPIALISGMSRAAREGIIIKNGTALERLAETRTFAFDKTGTLTRGELRVEKVQTFGQMSRTRLLGLAASLEQHSGHAQAAAIVAKAAAERAKLVQVKQIREVAGKGLTATAKGEDIIVGRLGLLEERGVALPTGFRPGDYHQTSAFVAVDGTLAGALTFTDEIREESKRTLAGLRAQGVQHFLMVTGDHPATAQKIAKQLGITDVVAGALPGDKIRAIEGIKQRPVAFVGDGVNDAPVLTASDVGIALGARGAAAASESADVVIMQDDLARVAHSVAIAHRTFAIAKQSVLVGIGLSVGLMFIFASGKFMPIYGAVVQELVDVVVIFNALRAHKG